MLIRIHSPAPKERENIENGRNTVLRPTPPPPLPPQKKGEGIIPRVVYCRPLCWYRYVLTLLINNKHLIDFIISAYDELSTIELK